LTSGMAINLICYSTADRIPRWGVVRADMILPLPGEYTSAAEVIHEGSQAARSLLADSGNS
jgi:2,4-diketo-3-deoxy-L-fuconate hydrolase